MSDKQAAGARFQQNHAELHQARLNPEPATGLSIVIPTYNAIGTVEPLLAQLATLPEVQSGNYEIVLTDDASTDGTIAKLREVFPKFQYVENAVNTGFGPNANRGIAVAGKGYIAVINTDIELVGNPFPELMDELHRDQDLFALMPLVYNTALDKVENLQTLRAGRGLVWNADLPEAERFTAIIKSNRAEGQSGSNLLQDAPNLGIVPSLLCGACFLCCTLGMRELGGFDARFAPFYWEDVDLGWASRRLTKGSAAAVGVLTTELVIHRHSESINRAHGDRKYRFLRLNQLRFVLKSFPWVRARYWWFLRAIRECFGGDAVLRNAYFKAAFGAREV